MTDKEFVLSVHPYAVCYYSCSSDSYFVVEVLGNEICIGRGTIARSAWKNAARVVRETLASASGGSMSEVKIPDDLKDTYELVSTGAIHIGGKYAMQLIERIGKQDAVLRLMLEALKDLTTVTVDFSKIDAAIAAGREALK